VIRKYSDDLIETDLVFIPAEPLTIDDEDSPSQISLYSRSSNETGNWNHISSASEVDEAANSIKFNDISGFSQYILGRKYFPDDQAGYCLNFDGIDDRIYGGGIQESFSGISLEVWVNHEELNGNIQRYITLEPELAVLRYDGEIGQDQLHFYIKQADGVLQHIRVNNILTNSEWYHVAGTYDGNEMKLYLNGAEIGNNITSGGFYQGNGNFSFSSTGESMLGKIDEARLWNTVRTANDIRENMYLSLSGAENGLINYWQFNSQNENILYDCVNADDGILKNIDNSGWITSSIPFGSGFSNSQTELPGSVSFTNTDISMDFTSIGTAEITVTKIESFGYQCVQNYKIYPKNAQNAFVF